MSDTDASNTVVRWMSGIAALSECASAIELCTALDRLCTEFWPDAALRWQVAADGAGMTRVGAPVAADEQLAALAVIADRQLQTIVRRRQEQSERLTVIGAIEQTVAGQPLDHRQLTTLLASLTDALDVRGLALSLVDAGSGKLELVGSAGESPLPGAGDGQSAAGEGRIPNSWQTLELRGRDRVLYGVLAVLPRTVHLSTETSDVLTLLCRVIADTRERESLARARQRNLDQMTALHGLSLAVNRRPLPGPMILNLTAAGMRELSAAEAVYLVVRREADGPLGQFTLDGLVGALPDELAAVDLQLPENGRPLVVAGTPTLLVIPLSGLSDMTAAVVLSYCERMPTPADIEMLVLFATQASVALEANSLLDALRRTNEQLDTVMSVTRDGMLLVGSDGQILLANRAMVDLLTLSGLAQARSAVVTGRPVTALLAAWTAAAGWQPDGIQGLQQALFGDDAAAPDTTEGTLRRTGVDLAWTVVRARALGTATNWAALLTLRDITEAANAERLREDLSDMIVHDLRSPLSSVLSSFELALRHSNTNHGPIPSEILQVGRQAALRLLDIVTMMLDISRLENGSLPLNPEPVTIGALVNDVCATVGLIAAQKEQQLIREIGQPDCVVIADRQLLTRVLQNLLDNAVKFTPRGGTIQIVGCCDERSTTAAGTRSVIPPHAARAVRLSVLDSGPGIAPHALDSIFDKFTQLRQHREGSGLGLTFCKLVTDAHGGRIWAENQSQGGSAFHLELTMQPPAA